MENPIKKPRTAWTVDNLADWLSKYDEIHKAGSTRQPYDKETWRIIVQNVALDYADSQNEHNPKTEDKLEKGMCPHRWSVTFQVTCVGFGDTKEEAIDEARRYGLEDYIRDTDSFEVVKTVYANDQDTCDTCEEIADEMLGGTFQKEE